MEKKSKYNEAENFRGFMKKFTDVLKVNPEDVKIEQSINFNDKDKNEGETNG